MADVDVVVRGVMVVVTMVVVAMTIMVMAMTMLVPLLVHVAVPVHLQEFRAYKFSLRDRLLVALPVANYCGLPEGALHPPPTILPLLLLLFLSLFFQVGSG